MRVADIDNRNQNLTAEKVGGGAIDRSADHSLKVSIVIPVHNGGEKFRRCLETVSALQPPPLELIVVSDGDTNGSADMAAQFDAQVIRLAERGGPARARNEGAWRARGEILLFIDADVAVPPDLIHRVIEAFEGAPHAAAIMGSYDCDPAASGVISQYKNLLHHYVHQQSNEDAMTFWGACGAIRRDVFAAIGGFDERYRRPCVEDIDLGYRLRAANHAIRLHKTLQVKHLKSWSFFSLLNSDIRDRALPWTELITRHHIFRNDLNLRYSDRLSVLTVFALLPTSALAAWLPALIIVPASLLLLLLIFNAPLYRFFIARRGFVFALAVIPLHWLSFAYGGLAFAAGVVRYGLVPRLTMFFQTMIARTSKSASIGSGSRP
jgi:GT2 family glycosyltransferase